MNQSNQTQYQSTKSNPIKIKHQNQIASKQIKQNKSKHINSNQTRVNGIRLGIVLYCVQFIAA